MATAATAARSCSESAGSGPPRQPRDEQVEVHTEQPVGCLARHRVRDGGALIAALGHVAGVAEPVHQFRPGLRDAAGVPAELGRLSREGIAGYGREHDVERVLGASTVTRSGR